MTETDKIFRFMVNRFSPTMLFQLKKQQSVIIIKQQNFILSNMAGVRPILAQLRVKIKCTIPNKYKTETYSI